MSTNKTTYMIDGDFEIGRWKVSGDIEGHTHDYIELAYLETGKLLHICGEIEKTIYEGDYFIIDYTISHRLKYLGARSVVINCMFRPSFLDMTLRNCRNFNEVLNNYLIHFDQRCNFKTHSGEIFRDADRRIYEILLKIDSEYDSENPGMEQLIRAYIVEIIIMTMRKLKLEDAPFSSDIERIKKKLRNDYNLNIRLCDIASELNISTQHLSRKFTKITGSGFKEYHQRIRVEEACRLLANTNLSIIEISSRVGYSDIKFFNAIFRKYMFTSPSEYRLKYSNKC